VESVQRTWKQIFEPCGQVVVWPAGRARGSVADGKSIRSIRCQSGMLAIGSRTSVVPSALTYGV